MKKNRALITSSAGVQDQEFIYPYFRLLEEEIDVDVFLLENQYVKGFMGTNIPPIKTHELIEFNKINVDEYDILILPGGVKSMEKLRLYNPLIKLISEFNSKKKIIGSICSAAQLLISAKIVKNRKVSGYYSMKDDLVNAGAIYTDLPSVIDDNLVTTAHYKDLGPWMRSIIKLYNNL